MAFRVRGECTASSANGAKTMAIAGTRGGRSMDREGLHGQGLRGGDRNRGTAEPREVGSRDMKH